MCVITFQLDGAQWLIFMLPSPRRGIGSSPLIRETPLLCLPPIRPYRRPSPSTRESGVSQGARHSSSRTHAITVTSPARPGAWPSRPRQGRHDWRGGRRHCAPKRVCGCGPGRTAPHEVVARPGAVFRAWEYLGVRGCTTQPPVEASTLPRTLWTRELSMSRAERGWAGKAWLQG